MVMKILFLVDLMRLLLAYLGKNLLLVHYLI
jgi:hypothetical protein